MSVLWCRSSRSSRGVFSSLSSQLHHEEEKESSSARNELSCRRKKKKSELGHGALIFCFQSSPLPILVLNQKRLDHLYSCVLDNQYLGLLLLVSEVEIGLRLTR